MADTLTWHYVERWAAERPDSEALVFEKERLTWRDFKVSMDAVALAFLEAGVMKGDRVALLSMARTEFLNKGLFFARLFPSSKTMIEMQTG